MTRQAYRQVHDQLVDWAESGLPQPSPELARLLGPIRPVTAAPAGRSWRAAVRAGAGLNVVAIVGGLALTSAAAVGVAEVALREPGPSSSVIAPVDPTDVPPSASAQSAPRRVASTQPTPSTASTLVAGSGPHLSDAPQPRSEPSHLPTPSPTEHRIALSPEPVRPSSEPSEPSNDSPTPEPTDSASPTTEAPAPVASTG